MFQGKNGFASKSERKGFDFDKIVWIEVGTCLSKWTLLGFLFAKSASSSRSIPLFPNQPMTLGGGSVRRGGFYVHPESLTPRCFFVLTSPRFCSVSSLFWPLFLSIKVPLEFGCCLLRFDSLRRQDRSAVPLQTFPFWRKFVEFCCCSNDHRHFLFFCTHSPALTHALISLDLHCGIA